MRVPYSIFASLVLPAVVFAQSDLSLRNWTVPPLTSSSVAGELVAMTDVTQPRAFVGVEPCRIVDTRGTPGFPAGFGPPNLTPGVERVFDLNSGPCPLLPAVIDAYSLNVTVVSPAGPGHLVIWPTGHTEPAVSSMNYASGQTLANAVIVPAGSNGAISVKAGVSGTHVLIDINGYFSSTGTGFLIETIFGGTTATFVNDTTTCGAFCSLYALSLTQTQGKASVGWVPAGGFNSAGVLGMHGSISTPGYDGAGVRGEGPLTGVLGVSRLLGVTGSLINASNAELAWGALGSNTGVDSANPPWGVFAGGNIGAVGTKHFLDPHPTDPNRSIAYISLEGPEAGTYFRGRGRFQNGIARIAVPDHFRMVTDPEGLGVQVTPIGPMATVSVLKVDLNEIVVQASRDVDFYYMVNGVRASYKNASPFRDGSDFAPRSADSRLPEWLSPEQKRRLIQNGTYREDGSVNVETARRLGWDRVWMERARASTTRE